MLNMVVAGCGDSWYLDGLEVWGIGFRFQDAG